MVAGAAVDLVHRADVITGADDRAGRLILPLGTPGGAGRVRAAALFIDPLVSAVDGRLDSHKDAEIRQALDPLAAMAHETRVLISAIVHVGKRDTPDVLNAILGSRAFGATARAVLAAGRDPDCEEGSCVLSVEKNNLGSINLPGVRYRVDAVAITTSEGPTNVGRITRLGESDRRVRDFFGTSRTPEDRSALVEAREFLRELLADGPRFVNRHLRGGREARGRQADPEAREGRRRGPVGLSGLPGSPHHWFYRHTEPCPEGPEGAKSANTDRVGTLGTEDGEKYLLTCGNTVRSEGANRAGANSIGTLGNGGEPGGPSFEDLLHLDSGGSEAARNDPLPEDATFPERGLESPPSEPDRSLGRCVGCGKRTPRIPGSGFEYHSPRCDTCKGAGHELTLAEMEAMSRESFVSPTEPTTT